MSDVIRPRQRSPTCSQKDYQRVAILYDNIVCYFSMSGKLFSNCTSDLIFRQRLDPDETRRFYLLQNFEICLRKKVTANRKWVHDLLLLQGLVPPILNQLTYI